MFNMLRKNKYMLLLPLLLGVTSCGSGSNTTNESNAPIVDAGAAQIVNEQSVVTLMASAQDQDNDIATYQWKQLQGETVELSSTNTLSTSFTAPELTEAQSFEFELTVTDDDGNTASDIVEVEVVPVNELPTIVVDNNLTVIEGAEVELTSTVTDIDGEVINYEWMQTSGPSVDFNVIDNTKVQLVAPNVTNGERLSFELKVTDNEGGVNTDRVNVDVLPVITHTLNASSYRFWSTSIDNQALFEFDASEFSGQIIWQQLSGPEVLENGSGEDKISFLSPKVGKTELIELTATTPNNIYTFRITLKPFVTDIAFADENLKSCVDKQADISMSLKLDEFTKLEGCEGQVASLAGIASLTKLKELRLPASESALESEKITDISDLASPLRLEVLDLSGHAISDVSVLQDSFTSMEELNLARNNIIDATGLHHFGGLKTIDVSDNDIRGDLGFLMYRPNGHQEGGAFYLNEREFNYRIEFADLAGNNMLSCEELELAEAIMTSTNIVRPTNCLDTRVTTEYGIYTGVSIKEIPYTVTAQALIDSVTVSNTAEKIVYKEDGTVREGKLESGDVLKISALDNFELPLTVNGVEQIGVASDSASISYSYAFEHTRHSFYFNAVAGNSYSIIAMHSDFFWSTVELLDSEFNFVDTVKGGSYAGAGPCEPGEAYSNCYVGLEVTAVNTGPMYLSVFTGGMGTNFAHGANIWVRENYVEPE